MPVTAQQLSVDRIAHAVVVTDDMDWSTATPLCGRPRRIGEWDEPDPNRAFKDTMKASRCFYCTAMLGDHSSRARRD